VVDIYDDGTATWVTDTLSQARQELTATTVGDSAIFAGGLVTSYSDLSDVVNIYTIPEPAALSLLVLGGLAMR